MAYIIPLAVFVALFLIAAYMVATLEDKLTEERHQKESLLNDIAYLKAQLKLKGDEA